MNERRPTMSKGPSFVYPAKVTVFLGSAAHPVMVRVDAGAGRGTKEYFLDPADRGTADVIRKGKDKAIERLVLALAEARGVKRGQIVDEFLGEHNDRHEIQGNLRPVSDRRIEAPHDQAGGPVSRKGRIAGKADPIDY